MDNHCIVSDNSGHSVTLCQEELCELLAAVRDYNPRAAYPARFREGGCELDYYRSMQKKLDMAGFWDSLPDSY